MTPGIHDKYFFRGPYSSDRVWNLADNITPRGEANLLSLERLTGHEQTGPGHAQVPHGTRPVYQ